MYLGVCVMRCVYIWVCVYLSVCIMGCVCTSFVLGCVHYVKVFVFVYMRVCAHRPPVSIKEQL